MGATTPLMILKGRSGATYSLSLYYAGGDAPGYIVPCTFNGVATANSPKDFVIPEPCVVKHITGPATGRITIDCNGQATPINIDMATTIAMVNVPGNTVAQLAGGANRRYSIRVTIAMAA